MLGVPMSGAMGAESILKAKATITMKRASASHFLNAISQSGMVNVHKLR